MENIGITKIPQLNAKPLIYNYPCSIEDSLAPSEVEATLTFGNQKIYVLAPINKVDKVANMIQVYVIGNVDDSLLISLPGEVTNSNSTILVNEEDFKGVPI